jgi:hypothetical protein
MTDFRRGIVSALLAVALASGAGSTITGCARTITPAEIDRNGTKTFHGREAGQVVRATVAALRTLGYEVVVADVAGGKVKTAPKLVTVHAVGNQYHATAMADSLAWSIDFVKATDGTVVRLHPRMYRNGQPIDETMINADPMNKAFADLFKEIDENLPGGASVDPVTPTTTSTTSTTSTTKKAEAKASKSSKYAKTAQ